MTLAAPISRDFGGKHTWNGTKLLASHVFNNALSIGSSPGVNTSVFNALLSIGSTRPVGSKVVVSWRRSYCAGKQD